MCIRDRLGEDPGAGARVDERDQPVVQAAARLTVDQLDAGSVSYTHLTLPPGDLEEISGGPVSLKKKTTQ